MKCAVLNEQIFKLINTLDMKNKTSKLQRIKAFFIHIVRRSFMLQKANARLNEVDFYDLMQAYRHAPRLNQDEAVKRYEAVKEWIRQNYA